MSYEKKRQLQVFIRVNGKKYIPCEELQVSYEDHLNTDHKHPTPLDNQLSAKKKSDVS